MTQKIKGRDAFLSKLSERLQKRYEPKRVNVPEWSYSPQHRVLQHASKDELLDVFQKECEAIHTDVYTTTLEQLPIVLDRVIQQYEGQSIIKWKDERFHDWKLDTLFEKTLPRRAIEVMEWNEGTREENIEKAERADIGIAISEYAISESATVVLLTERNHGRVVNFLPEKSIVLIPKSTLVPRMTQVAAVLRREQQEGKSVPSCINYITGPSNSADIEMRLVVGVHGPMKMAYVVIEDI